MQRFLLFVDEDIGNALVRRGWWRCLPQRSESIVMVSRPPADFPAPPFGPCFWVDTPLADVFLHRWLGQALRRDFRSSRLIVIQKLVAGDVNATED